jgi:hypothetical protein
MEYAVNFSVKMAAETVFIRITAPLQTLLKKEADQLHGDRLLYKLSLYFFTMNLVYAIINKIASEPFGHRHQNLARCPETRAG